MSAASLWVRRARSHASTLTKELTIYLGLAQILVQRTQAHPAAALVLNRDSRIYTFRAVDLGCSLPRMSEAKQGLRVNVSGDCPATLQTLTEQARGLAMPSEQDRENLAVTWSVERGALISEAVRQGAVTAFLARDGSWHPGLQLTGNKWEYLPAVDERAFAIGPVVTEGERQRAREKLSELAATGSVSSAAFVRATGRIDAALTADELSRASRQPKAAWTHPPSTGGRRRQPAGPEHHEVGRRPALGPTSHRLP